VQYDALRASRTAVSVTLSAASAFQMMPLGKTAPVKTFMANAGLHRQPKVNREHFDTAQILSFILLLLSLAPQVQDIDLALRRALTQSLWAIDGHSRSSDTHCLFREKLLDLRKHTHDPPGSYSTRVCLFWPKEVKPGSNRSNSSGRTGHWSKYFKIWSTTPGALCTLTNLRTLFADTATAAHTKVAAGGGEFTPAWHGSVKRGAVYPPVAASTVASEVGTVMLAAGLRDGETAHSIRGASASKACQLSNGMLKPQVLETARWSTDAQFSTSYEGYVRCWDTTTPSTEWTGNPQQVQRWGVIQPSSWVGTNVMATMHPHEKGHVFQPLTAAVVTAMDEHKARGMAVRPLPRARIKSDRKALLRAHLPIFKITASDGSWSRSGVPYAVIADGHRRWLDVSSGREDACSMERWC